MTDEKKPVWIRHPPCGVLIFNESLNVKAHKLNCTFDIKMAAQKLEERVAKLEGRVQTVEEAPEPEPAVALDDIGEWVDDDDWDEDSTLDVPVSPITATGSTTRLYPEDDDDEDALR